MDAPTRRHLAVRLGAGLWMLQALAFVVEAVTIAAVRAPYSLIDNTLSDLGAVGCGTVAYPGLDVAVCSPAHALFNTSLVAGAVAVAVGAVLLLPELARGRGRSLGIAGVVVLVGAQVSGALTGLVPIDVDTPLHTLVSAPGFVLQPAALVLLGVAGRRRGAWWGVPLPTVGGLTLLAGLFFVLRLDPAGGGLLERLVLWPAIVALALVGLSILVRSLRRG